MGKIDYKVGDKIVRKKEHLHYGFEKDNGPFVAVFVDNVGFARTVTLDRNPKGGEYGSMNWDADRFEKYVEPVKPKPATPDTYILVLKDAGVFKPNTKPRTYSTEAQAKRVAADMAVKHPGQEFVIFKAVGKAKTVAATVEMY